MSLSLRPPLPSDYATLAAWVGDVHACARWAGPQLKFPFAAAELQTLLSSESMIFTAKWL